MCGNEGGDVKKLILLALVVAAVMYFARHAGSNDQS